MKSKLKIKNHITWEEEIDLFKVYCYSIFITIVEYFENGMIRMLKSRILKLP